VPSQQETNGLRRSFSIKFALTIVVLAVITAGVFMLAVSPRNDQITAAADAPVPVTAAVAVRKDVPDFINTIGTVQSMDSVAIQSQVNGALVKVEVTPGQEVKKRQELFLVDPRPFQAALDLAQAQLAHDKAVLGEAQMDLKRYQLLARENSIALQQAQDQTYVVKQDEGSVQIDEANVETAQINLGYAHITAPISGRAGALLAFLGDLVGPQVVAQTSSSGTTSGSAGPPGQAAISGELISVTQMQPIYVSFPVPQTMLDEVRQNQHKMTGGLDVEAYSQSGKLLEKGKLTVINNQVNPSTGTVLMQATFANADEVLWPGQFVSVRLIVFMRRNVVTVPAEAVMMGPSGYYVYVIGPDQTVHRVNVQVAARQSGIAVIEKGISAGEQVVTAGQYRLANGVKVDVQQTTEASVAQQ
jgi:membrane fusion protein, multidrug efflux system